MIKKLTSMGHRRFIGMIIGNVLLGIGVSVFKFSGMGNDPFSAMCMAVSNQLNLPYASFLVLLNVFIFIIEITFGRKLIGVGTFVNWFLVGYVAEFFMWLADITITPPQTIFLKLLFVILGVILTSLGVSLYQTSDAGISPYDSVSLIMKERLPIPYFWCRMTNDGLCAIIALLAGGLIGLGTFICALCLGPIIHFFNEKFSKKVLFKQSAQI